MKPKVKAGQAPDRSWSWVNAPRSNGASRSRNASSQGAMVHTPKLFMLTIWLIARAVAENRHASELRSSSCKACSRYSLSASHWVQRSRRPLRVVSGQGIVEAKCPLPACFPLSPGSAQQLAEDRQWAFEAALGNAEDARVGRKKWPDFRRSVNLQRHPLHRLNLAL